MTQLKIDLTDLKKELRGIVYKSINDELERFDIKAHIEKVIRDNIKKSADRMMKGYVYSYLEESQIVVPNDNSWNRDKKIALNTFIIQIIREVITNRVVLKLDDIKIEIEGSEPK